METIHEKIMKEKNLTPEDATALLLRTQKILHRSADKHADVLNDWLGVPEIFLKDVLEFDGTKELPSPKEKELAIEPPPADGALKIGDIVLSDDQAAAYDIMQKIPKGGMLFLTGRAGTGKSTLVDCFCAGRGDVARLASTGIAAQNIDGRTLDAFLGLIPDNTWTIDPFKLIRRLAGIQFVVIDEISMVGLEKFDFSLDSMFKANKNLKFIFVGDFHQLPPVKDHYCHRSPYWPDVHCIELTHIHRQNDAEFIAALNAVRDGNFHDPIYDKIYHERYTDSPPDDCICIAPHIKTSEYINNDRLKALGEQIHYKEAVVEHGYWKNNRIPQTVRYAEGCRVLMLSNDRDKRWANGSLGTVTEVGTYHVKVAIDDGMVEMVTPEQFELFNGDGDVILRFQQFPFQLGYAITIHKSQGLTLDKLVIDMDNHFGQGMTYVALSRCRTREGLYLTTNVLNGVH